MGRKRRDDISMSSSTAVLEAERRSETTCHHYWIIELPNGPTSRGRCKYCGLEREFDNLGPDSWRYGDISELMATNPPVTAGEGD